MADLRVKIDQNSDTYGEICQIKALLEKNPWYKLQNVTTKQVVALAVAEYRDKLLAKTEALAAVEREKRKKSRIS